MSDEKTEIIKVESDEIEKFFNEINEKIDLDKLRYSIDPITKFFSMWMHYWEGITFEGPHFPSILGFKVIRDGKGYHFVCKESSQIHITSRNLISDYPVDISAGTQMMFIYLDITHNQIVVGTKTPLRRVIDTNRRVKNGYACSLEPNHRKAFTNWEYKKLLVKNIQSVAVNLQTETGRILLFVRGEGKVVLTLKFQKFSD